MAAGGRGRARGEDERLKESEQKKTKNITRPKCKPNIMKDRRTNNGILKGFSMVLRIILTTLKKLEDGTSNAEKREKGEEVL